jgi:hypothetical protein
MKQQVVQPLMNEPVLVFRVHKQRVKNEYWIFDCRVTNPEDPERLWQTDARWPFRLIRKNSRGGWRAVHWAQSYNAAYAYAHKRAGNYTDKGVVVEKLMEEMGTVAYIPTLNPSQAFVELIDRAKKSTSHNRLTVVEEINDVLKLMPVLTELRDSLIEKTNKTLGI